MQETIEDKQEFRTCDFCRKDRVAFRGQAENLYTAERDGQVYNYAARRLLGGKNMTPLQELTELTAKTLERPLSEAEFNRVMILIVEVKNGN